MSHHRIMHVTLQLAQVRVIGDDEPRATDCLRCSAALELTQPDPEDPERLIGACFDCGAWFLIGLPAGESLVEVLELPRRGARAGPILSTIGPGAIDGRPCQAGA